MSGVSRHLAIQLIAHHEQSKSGGEVLRERISGALYHSVGDREDAVRQLDLDFTALHNEIMGEMGWTKDAPNAYQKDARYGWWSEQILPIVSQWIKFRDDQLGSWWERFSTNWDTYSTWETRLKRLRELARQQFTVVTPEPVGLSTTFLQDAGSGLGEMIGFIKTVLWVGIAIGGFVVVTTVLKQK